jgi:hypothetical protein
MPWGKRETGTVEINGVDKVVTFREGTGDKAGQTLVGGGELSGSQFDKAHDHYGSDTSKSTDHGNLDNAPSVDAHIASQKP